MIVYSGFHHSTKEQIFFFQRRKVYFESQIWRPQATITHLALSSSGKAERQGEEYAQQNCLLWHRRQGRRQWGRVPEQAIGMKDGHQGHISSNCAYLWKFPPPFINAISCESSKDYLTGEACPERRFGKLLTMERVLSQYLLIFSSFLGSDGTLCSPLLPLQDFVCFELGLFYSRFHRYIVI